MQSTSRTTDPPSLNCLASSARKVKSGLRHSACYIIPPVRLFNGSGAWPILPLRSVKHPKRKLYLKKRKSNHYLIANIDRRFIFICVVSMTQILFSNILVDKGSMVDTYYTGINYSRKIDKLFQIRRWYSNSNQWYQQIVMMLYSVEYKKSI